MVANDPKRVYATPLEADSNRVSPRGRFAVWASDNSGKDWHELNKGLQSSFILYDSTGGDEFRQGRSTRLVCWNDNWSPLLQQKSRERVE
ncbi:MAG: hypothetical protein ACRECH_04895 [Nitrososphaerales archaeon]